MTLNRSHTVILDGYLDPAEQPVLTTSYKLPKNVVPDGISHLVVQTNLENGMTF